MSAVCMTRFILGKTEHQSASSRVRPPRGVRLRLAKWHKFDSNSTCAAFSYSRPKCNADDPGCLRCAWRNRGARSKLLARHVKPGLRNSELSIEWHIESFILSTAQLKRSRTEVSRRCSRNEVWLTGRGSPCDCAQFGLASAAAVHI